MLFPFPFLGFLVVSAALTIPYVNLHSEIITNGDEIDGLLLAVETNSSLPKLTVLTQNGSLSLLKRGNIYVPEERVFVDRVALQELPYNATFRVFYSSFPVGYLPPLNFSDGKFILASAVSVNVSAYGFYLNVTYPRGSLFVTGENGMGFTLGRKAVEGNRLHGGYETQLLGIRESQRCGGLEA
ncbi:hypothetical protein [Thermococcus sp.]|uniref:hypothetical protein n=1 Tax=Thermococcus sp. TaxID=35749 RepID=UPI00261CD090|nr:hypothetical protein [Thermococcus sp.]